MTEHDLPSCLFPQALSAPALDWSCSTTPLARDFDDVYFTRDQGLAEAEYVFLQANHLPERWQAWAKQRAFVIGETGWGTGLNFLLAWQQFLHYAPATARLHWISTELWPLSHADLQRAHQAWPTLKQEAAQLRQHYPLPISGLHRLHPHPRITLDLLFGDAATNLRQVSSKIDAWCLDGFAPSKNPAMWSEALFTALAQASHAETTFATFTSAGLVKRGLTAAGFTWQKVPGFGRKKEMLCGHYQRQAEALVLHCADSLAPSSGQHNSLSLFTAPAPSLANHYSDDAQRIAVIGAGLAGLSTALALSKKGCMVDVYEAQEIGAGGSGNRQGVLYIKLAAQTNSASRFYLAGLEYTLRWLAELDPAQALWRDCGVLQLAHTPEEVTRQARCLQTWTLPHALVHAVDAQQASQIAAQHLDHGGLFYPRAGWVRPQALCQFLAQQQPDSLRVILRQPIEQITPYEQGWHVHSDGRTHHYHHLVVAAGHASAQFKPTAWLPLKPIRGQVSLLPLQAIPDTKIQLNSVVCAGGYVTPPWDEQLSFGATYDLHDYRPCIKQEDHQVNLDQLQYTLPSLLDFNALTPAQLTGRAAVRCATPDYLPLVGPAPVSDMKPWPAHPGLWINTGHGSRGLASIPLSAELLACQILGDPLPLDTYLCDALQPVRFLLPRKP